MAKTPNDRVDEAAGVLASVIGDVIEKLDDISDYVLEVKDDEDLTLVNQFSQGTAKSVASYLFKLKLDMAHMIDGLHQTLEKVKRDVEAGRGS